MPAMTSAFGWRDMRSKVSQALCHDDARSNRVRAENQTESTGGYTLSKFLVLLSLILLVALPCHADEHAAKATMTENADNEKNNNAGNSRETKAEKPSGKTPPGLASPEFNPSEEISEDLSVPFPVDI